MGMRTLPLLVATVSLLSHTADAFSAARLSLGQEADCRPWAVPVADRCSYVRNNSAVCFPDGGIQQYLQVHYCDFGQAWQVASFGLLLVAMVICLGFLLTAAERFFCPSLELISEFLRLPPAVAGATLLSFGNGAPDVFTQLAAVRAGGPGTLGITLAEPLGGGLFTSNVVLGAVVLLSSRSQAVALRPAPFLKDLLFYLAALGAVLMFMRDGKVHLWETGLLLLLYVAYVLVTFYVCRGDEPVHADHHHHELPLEDLQGEVDTCSECDSEHESPHCKQHAAWIAGGGWDAAAQTQTAAADAAGGEEDLTQPLLPTVQAAAAPLGAEHGQPRDGAGHLVVAVSADSAASSPQQQYEPPSSAAVSPSDRAAAAAAAVAAADQQPAAADVEAGDGGVPSRPAAQVLQRRVSFADKPSVLSPPVLPPIRCSSPSSEGAGPSSSSALNSPEEVSWGPEKAELGGKAPVRQLKQSTSMVVHQGAVQHVPSWHSWLQRPFVLVLATTMPRVGSSHAHHYPYWRAALLPFTTPLFVLAVVGIRVQPTLEALPLQLVLAWAAAGAAAALALRRVYPRDGFPYGRLLGGMAALSFCLSIMWLNVAASLLVELCVVLGKIWGISPALLGATVLAWGNSMPDLVNNVSMGRDGFPVMAITACFASPMFSLLVGMGTALAVGAIEDGGELAVRVTKPLLVMYGFAAVNLVKFLVLVPLLYGYVLRRSLAFLAFGFYLTFNVVYMLVQAGVLSV